MGLLDSLFDPKLQEALQTYNSMCPACQRAVVKAGKERARKCLEGQHAKA